MPTLTRESPGKLNLTLRVAGKRPDGYHEIESLVARVALADSVTVADRDDTLRTLECDDSSIPTDERNLALLAAAKLAQASGVSRGVRITLNKRIPAGAGMGGGSSNAATTLMLLNELWGLNWPAARLLSIAASIGSDVPLFFHAPLCVLRGRGERVEDLAFRFDAWAMLVFPPISTTSAAVYRAWDELHERPARARLDGLYDLIRAASRNTNPPSDVVEPIMRLLYNDLEMAACRTHPELVSIAQGVQRLARRAVRMTGSGAVWYRLFQNEADAAKLAAACDKSLNIQITKLA